MVGETHASSGGSDITLVPRSGIVLHPKGEENHLTSTDRMNMGQYADGEVASTPGAIRLISSSLEHQTCCALSRRYAALTVVRTV